LTLDADVYERLAEQAKAEDRDPVQQARYLIRKAVKEQAPAPAPAATKVPR
jgi:hypothetical protein